MSKTTECMTCHEIFIDMDNFNKHPCVSTADEKEGTEKEDPAKSDE